MSGPFIQTIVSRADMIGRGIRTGVAATGIVKPLTNLGNFANKHMRLFIRLILVAYSALTIYNLLYIQPLEFFPTEHNLLTINRFILVLSQFAIIGIGLYGEFMQNKQCIHIVSISTYDRLLQLQVRLLII